MGLVINWQYFRIFISAKKMTENVFHDILERKNTFLKNKNNKLIKSKYWHFPKEVSPWFWSKIGKFSIFLFQPKNDRKMRFTIF